METTHSTPACKNNSEIYSEKHALIKTNLVILLSAKWHSLSSYEISWVSYSKSSPLSDSNSKKNEPFYVNPPWQIKWRIVGLVSKAFLKKVFLKHFK